MEAVTYKTDYDAQIKLALRKCTSEEDFMETTLKEILDEILLSLEAETNGKPKGVDQTQEEPDERRTATSSPQNSEAMLVKIKEDAVAKANFKDPDNKLPKWLQYAETATALTAERHTPMK